MTRDTYCHFSDSLSDETNFPPPPPPSPSRSRTSAEMDDDDNDARSSRVCLPFFAFALLLPHTQIALNFKLALSRESPVMDPSFFASAPHHPSPSSSSATTFASIQGSLPDPSPSCVLLLIDIQVGLLSDPPIGIPSASTLSTNVHLILTHARAIPHPPLIIHVRNAGAPGEPDEPGSPGWELKFSPLPSEPVVDKSKNNAFAGTRLPELIPIDAELIVVGCQSDFCVRATCSAALARGNEVLLIRGAHGTYDRDEVWNGGTVTPARTVEAEIEAELEEAGVVLLEMDDLPKIFADDR